MGSKISNKMDRALRIMIYIIIIIAIVIPIYLWRFKIKIDWASIARKTLKLDTGIFGVYCFDGKQGSGKTYALVKYIKKHAKGKKIYSNITLRGVEYEKILSVQQLMSLRDKKKVVIVYDEILNMLNDKTIPKNIRNELMEFLTQQRKMKNIMLTTTQEWLNMPIEFRRFVRIQIICKTKPLGKIGGVLREEYRDAYEMKWDQLENEYVAPRISLKFSKYEKRFMESYDTYERVRGLKATI